MMLRQLACTLAVVHALKLHDDTIPSNLCINGRLAPELFVLGAQKASSSSFFWQLNDPQKGNIKLFSTIEMVNGQRTNFGHKEPHTFDRKENFDKGMSHWLSSYPTCPGSSPRMVAADGTPNYLASKEAPARIAKWYGDQAKHLRFVILLRDPIKRMQSAHYAFHRKDTSFSKYADKVLAGKDPYDNDDIGPYQMSLYASQLKNWFETFNSSQFLIVPYKYNTQKAEKGKLTPVQAVWQELGLPVLEHPQIHSQSGHHEKNALQSSKEKKLREKMAPLAGADAIAQVLMSSGQDAVLYGFDGMSAGQAVKMKIFADSSAEIARWLSNGW